MGYYDGKGDWHAGDKPGRGVYRVIGNRIPSTTVTQHTPRPPGWQELAQKLSSSRPNTLVLEVKGLRNMDKSWPLIWDETDTLEDGFNLEGVREYLAKYGRKPEVEMTAYWNGNQVDIPR